jgi:hypothetical protein
VTAFLQRASSATRIFALALFMALVVCPWNPVAAAAKTPPEKAGLHETTTPKADPAETSFDRDAVAEKILDLLTSQSDSVQNWALAVIGGSLALVFTVVQHNFSADSRPIHLVKIWMVPVALSLEGLSIMLSYMVRDALISMPPLIYGVQFSGQAPFLADHVPGAGAELLQGEMLLQFATFFMGVILMAAFCLENFIRLNRHEITIPAKSPPILPDEKSAAGGSVDTCAAGADPGSTGTKPGDKCKSAG